MLISPCTLHSFIRDLFTGYGAGAVQAEAVARHMVWCEMVGRSNFGIERIAVLVKRLKADVLAGDGAMSFERLGPSIERLDAARGFGFDAAERAMERAIELAGKTGIGVVGVRNSNFLGAGAYYVNMACADGMIGLATSNSYPKVVAHGGFRPVLGTNPFAFGAPRKNGEHLLFDMATSALAGSTVREHIAKGEPLPEGLAIDGEGNPITDASKVNEGALLPFGGPKGFGLALLVEILSGVLTGAGIGSGVHSMYSDFSRSGDNGHFLMALDIARWMSRSDYFARFEGLIAAIKESGDGVLLPGEVRWENYRQAEAKGIPLDPARWAEVVRIASTVSVTPPRQKAFAPA